MYYIIVVKPNLSYQEEEAQGSRKYRIKSAFKNEKPCLRREEESHLGCFGVLQWCGYVL